MSDIVTVRDADIVAAEINTIKREVQGVVIWASIKIGEKLTEAKSLVEHGQWGKWLEENVEYSQSTANYLMQLYQEYGTGQYNLFDSWTNSQTFANLNYSQHIALLALPFEDRQSFAEENNVAEMSARQVQQAVREAVAKTEQERDAAQEEKDRLAAELGDVRADLSRAIDNAVNAEQESKAFQRRMADAEKDKARAESSEKTALALVEKLKKQVKDAKAAEKKAREDLQAAKDKPQIPEAMMEQLRKEAAAEAAKAATEELERKLTEAQKRANAAVILAEEAEEKLKAAQKAVQMANPDVAVFQNLFVQVQELWKKTVGAYQKVRINDQAAGDKCLQALEKAVEMFRGSIAAK